VAAHADEAARPLDLRRLGREQREQELVVAHPDAAAAGHLVQAVVRVEPRELPVVVYFRP
jgi:hypothetical protein